MEDLNYKMSHADKFLEILFKEKSAIKYTVKFEDCRNSLTFLDTNITNNHLTKNTNSEYIDAIEIITKNVFEGCLHQAHTVCSEKYIKKETKFLVGMFVDNGHKRTFLEKLGYQSQLHQLKENPLDT